MVSEEKIQMWKIYKVRQTDNEWLDAQVISKASWSLNKKVFCAPSYVVLWSIFLDIIYTLPFGLSKHILKRWLALVWFMVFNATFNNISVISWRSVWLVEETGENHWPVASQTVSHNVVSSTPHHEWGSN